MKQAYLIAILCALIGWLVGDMLRPLGAQRVTPVLAERIVVKKAKRVGAGTIEIAADMSDRDKDLPPEVVDARTRGQQARMRALKEAIGKIGPKQGEWGQGGPLIPLREFTGRPRQRPMIVRAFRVTPSTFEAVPFADPLAPWALWFGPGDPSLPPHRSWTDLYPNFPGVPGNPPGVPGGPNPPGNPPGNPPANPPTDNPPPDNPPPDNPPPDNPPPDNPPPDNPPPDNPPPDNPPPDNPPPDNPPPDNPPPDNPPPDNPPPDNPPPDNPPPDNPPPDIPPPDNPPPDIPPPDNPPPDFPPPDGPPTSPIPEPGTWGLMILGFAALAWALRRRIARRQA